MMADVPTGLWAYLLVASIFLSIGMMMLWYFIQKIKESEARRDDEIQTLEKRLNVLTSHETSRRSDMERRMYIIERDIQKLKRRDD